MNSEKFDTEYKRLNLEQKQAVDAIEGPVMVNAGPGTGKTQILTLRIAQILKNTDVQPENILALTFTNSGVYAMRERLRLYIEDQAYRTNIFTFHAFCEHIIKTFPFYFPQFEYSHVIDDLQKVKCIEEILDAGEYIHLKGKHDDYQKIKDITRAISEIKKEGLSVQSFKDSLPIWKQEMLDDPKILYSRKYKEFNAGDIKPAEEEKIKRKLEQAQEIAEAYEQYQLRLEKEHLYDFSDMILTVVQELQTNFNLKSEVQETYQYILVDEHQDTNTGQNELIKLLTDAEHLEGHANIFTVGDEKQSIYRFQGASKETFTYFNTLYRDILHIDLKENYRSTQTILNASGAVIEHSLEDAVTLNSHSEKNIPIQIGEFSNYKFELLFLAQDIKQKIDAGVDPKEIAVLFRSNKHTEDIKSVLAHFKIPFTVFSKSSIFEDRDILNIILLMRIILNPNDEESLAKALFINFLHIGGYDVIKILQKRNHYKRESNKTLFEILNDVEILKEIGIVGIDAIIKFSSCIQKSIIEIQNVKLVDFLKQFLQDIEYTAYMLGHDLSRDKLLTIDKLFDEIKKQQTKQVFTAENFITLVDSYHAYHLDIENSNPEIESGVQLMTAHGSKGKEFEYVYIVNTVARSWEKSRSFGGIALPIKSYMGDEHDERRLFYVSMTRAKLGLSITNSKTDWEGKEQERSRFVTEIPNEFVQPIDTQSFEKEHIADIRLFIEPQNEKRTIYEPEFIKELFLKRGLTVTSLNNYISCPLKYFYKNLIQIPNGYSAVLEYGSIMHRALEKFFLQCAVEEKLLDKKILLDHYSEQIEHSQLGSKENKKYKQKGLDSLDSWFDARQSLLKWNIATERKVYKDFELESGETITLNGVIDKIEFIQSVLDGPIILVDYKTGKAFSKKQKEQKEDLKRQLLFYHILLENYKEDAYTIQEAALDFLEENEKGEHERYFVGASTDDIVGLKTKIQEVAHEIMSGDLLQRGCQKRDCEWCQFHK
jgi:DNA helicase-2/ATP-dependent DNA helicase PcrA